MIAFIESLGRIAVFEGMQKRDGINVEQSVLNKGIYMHSITNLLSSICMMPSAIYAENLAVMNLHNTETLQLSIREPDEDRFVNHCYTPYSIFPYIIASLICIIVAVISGLQSLLISIPLPILGGMELFVFSLIAAPGIQLLVEQQVNYKKISNQVITASVLLAGISNISFTYKSLALHGMSLGLTTGVMVNLIVLVLGYFGYLNERFSVIEIIDLCSDIFVNSVTLYCYGENGELTLEKRLDNKEIEKYVRRKDVASILKNSHMIRLVSETNRKEVGIIQEYGRICVKVKLQIRYSNRFLNDYPRVTVFNNASRIKTIVVDEYVSKRILTDILNNVD